MITVFAKILLYGCEIKPSSAQISSLIIANILKQVSDTFSMNLLFLWNTIHFNMTKIANKSTSLSHYLTNKNTNFYQYVSNVLQTLLIKLWKNSYLMSKTWRYLLIISEKFPHETIISISWQYITLILKCLMLSECKWAIPEQTNWLCHQLTHVNLIQWRKKWWYSQKGLPWYFHVLLTSVI